MKLQQLIIDMYTHNWPISHTTGSGLRGTNRHTPTLSGVAARAHTLGNLWILKRYYTLIYDGARSTHSMDFLELFLHN